MLENLLINMIISRVFPFGASLFEPETMLEPARQFALLATEFALIKGLLMPAFTARDFQSSTWCKLCRSS